ncbi:hypothetical protein pb186bvf_013164 [Paramecium bursaria]
MTSLLRRDSYSENYINSGCDMFEFQIDPWCQGQPDTNPTILNDDHLEESHKDLYPPVRKPIQKRQGRFKNVPYTMGRHFRNWIESEFGQVKCPIVTKFLNKRKSNPKYHDSFKDFNDVFKSQLGRHLGQLFFGMKKYVKYLLNNERVDDLGLFFEVDHLYYQASQTGAPLVEQKVRKI